MKSTLLIRLGIQLTLLLLCLFSCTGKKDATQFQSELKSLDLKRGDIALCGSENSKFGTVDFSLSCSDKVKANFNLATALLHSFEYPEAEKVFAKVIDEDPSCIMAYWGAAMCNFHPLWEVPSEKDLQKGEKIITLARSLVEDKTSRESEYLEAIACIYDQWDNLDHRTRLKKFEETSEKIHLKYPDDNEAAIFYALALRAAADPTDKSFTKPKKAGEILNAIFLKQPNHPGVAHYIIHTYDYPELAELGLPAARKYASIAATSAHALHMPSHIFTRLGLWDEAIQSNINSVAAAKCYAEAMQLKGHWSEELHGLDYLIYAYLQKGETEKVIEQENYVKTINDVFPADNKDAYSFAAVPTRVALEMKNWKAASELKLFPESFDWSKFLWEKSNVTFGRILGYVHLKKLDDAKHELDQLNDAYNKLKNSKLDYKANMVFIQIKASEAWIKLSEGNKIEALTTMIAAADMEDATEKHPVTPGEVLPARELLGDMYMELNEPAKALEAYQADLKRHANRYNALYGAGLAAEKSGNKKVAVDYYEHLLSIAPNGERPELVTVKLYVKKNKQNV